MALTASERTTEIVRPAGIETGGGAVDGTRGRARDGAKVSFEDVLARVDGPLLAIDRRVDVAAVIAAGRPIDQQREAIDQKQKMVERSRRKADPEHGVSALSHHGAEALSTQSEAASGKPRAAPSSAHDASGPLGHDRSGEHESGRTEGASVRGSLSFPSLASTKDAHAGATASAGGQADEHGGGRSSTVSSEAAGAVAVGVRTTPSRVDASTADAGVRGVEAVAGTSGGGQSGAAGGGLSDGSGRDAMSRLMGVGQRQGGAMAGGDARSPFKLEQESALAAQVSRGLAQVLKGGGGEITLRLRPEHLGEVRAQVRIENGVVAVRIEAASEQARSLLERDTATLRSALEARGLEVEHVRVEGPARSAERTGEASSETARDREDRDLGDSGEDRQADGDRQSHEDGAQGRAQRDVVGDVMHEASIAQDAGCAYGVEGRIASGVSWTGTDGVWRLDATA